MQSSHVVSAFLGSLVMGVSIPCATVVAQQDPPPAGVEESQPSSKPSTKTTTKVPVLDVDAVCKEGCEILLSMQENPYSSDPEAPPREWPYEGVYRVRDQRYQGPVIPMGYRVGGTAIATLAMIEAPNYRQSKDRNAAVERAVEFVLEGLEAPLMDMGFKGSYDVRGWGHTYALKMFLRMAELEAVPSRFAEEVPKRTKWLIAALETTAIPEAGGWNYSRRRGFRSSQNSPSPFMTAPTVQALLHAAARGHTIDREVVETALDGLERGRTDAGGMTYQISRGGKAGVEEDQFSMMDKMEGSIARLPAVEATLWIAGRGDQDRLCAAVEKFFVHWNALEVRRQKSGTHIMPFGVAPYYFIYGHYYVAQAIELIADASLRDAQRARFRAIMAKVREPNGGWNDRVFPRSRNFGTAMGMMALQMPSLPRPKIWGATK